MASLATPTKDQAEGYIATYALYQLCGKKGEKVYVRLPTIWRGLWAELAEEDRLKSGLQEREVLRGLRKLLGIGGDRNDVSGENQIEKKNRTAKDGDGEAKDVPQLMLRNANETEAIKEGWQYKINTPGYLHMLKGRQQLPMWGFKDKVLAAIEREQVVIICGETGWYSSEFHIFSPKALNSHRLTVERAHKLRPLFWSTNFPKENHAKSTALKYCFSIHFFCPSN